MILRASLVRIRTCAMFFRATVQHLGIAWVGAVPYSPLSARALWTIACSLSNPMLLYDCPSLNVSATPPTRQLVSSPPGPGLSTTAVTGGSGSTSEGSRSGGMKECRPASALLVGGLGWYGLC